MNPPHTTAPEEVHEGGCLCAGVRYRALGQPLRTLVCHCRFCQKVTGSTSYAESLFFMDKVEFSGLPVSQYAHLSAGSGKLVHVQFCPRCGTTLGLMFERWAEFRAVSRGTFDDPNWVTISSHIWTDSAQTGVLLPAHIDCYQGARATVDGQRMAAQRFDTPVPARRDSPASGAG